MHAIVLALDVPGALPLDRLAGLSLVARAVLVLQKLGATQLTVVHEGNPAIAASLQTDPRVKVALKFVRARSAKQPLQDVDPQVVSEARYLVRHEIVCDPVTAWSERIVTPTGRKRAFDRLFEACRKPVDGIVARHLNRHVSIFISKRLVETRITPNMISGLTFVLGTLAAICVAQGTYGMLLSGAALLQANSILDGVDGELARVRYQHSKLGQWLDTLSDDVTNVLFWAGLAIGVRHLPHGALLSMAGWTAAAANLIFAAIYWIELVHLGSGDVFDIQWAIKKTPPKGTWGKIVRVLGYLPRKDLFIFFCLVCAVIGVLPWVLPIIAIGAVGALFANIGRVWSKMNFARRLATGASPAARVAPSR